MRLLLVEDDERVMAALTASLRRHGFEVTVLEARAIAGVKGYSLPFSGPCFNEFVVRGPTKAVDLLSRLGEEKGIDGGIALSRFMPDRPNDFLVCVTETNSRAQIDAVVEALASFSHHQDTKTP